MTDRTNKRTNTHTPERKTQKGRWKERASGQWNATKEDKERRNHIQEQRNTTLTKKEHTHTTQQRTTDGDDTHAHTKTKDDDKHTDKWKEGHAEITELAMDISKAETHTFIYGYVSVDLC